MTRKKKLVTFVALITLMTILAGCGNSQEVINDEAQASMFEIITVDSVGTYEQTIVYDVDSKVEYAYLWHDIFNGGAGGFASTMLYMPDESPKLYTGKASKLIMVSYDELGTYLLNMKALKITVMYDSDTLVMYSCSTHGGSKEITIQVLRNDDGSLKLYMPLHMASR